MSGEEPTGAAPPSVATDLVAMLDIEELDRDLYRGTNSVDSAERPSLFGGQVAAQALRAAALTVPNDRAAHSLHGYFLRRGRNDRPVILRVDRDRDGRSFSARHVAAIQNGEVIFDMLASFHRHEDGLEFDGAPHGQPQGPEHATRLATAQLVDLRPARGAPDDDAEVRHERLWVRALEPLPDDPLVHACALTYASDFGSGFTRLDDPNRSGAGPSIDHTIWFHAPIRMDQWVLLEMWPLKAGGARGVYLGSMRDREGRLGATLAQESLLRRP